VLTWRGYAGRETRGSVSLLEASDSHTLHFLEMNSKTVTNLFGIVCPSMRLKLLCNGSLFTYRTLSVRHIALRNLRAKQQARDGDGRIAPNSLDPVCKLSNTTVSQGTIYIQIFARFEPQELRLQYLKIIFFFLQKCVSTLNMNSGLKRAESVGY
jgi:hypothetical protein